MRSPCLVIFVLCASAACGPAQALEADDTMAAWGAASADEKSKLVTELLKRDGRESGTASVVKCLDAAAAVSGHADLRIDKVVEACAKESGEPV